MMKIMSPGHVARRLVLSVSRIVQLDNEGTLVAMRDSAGRRFYDSTVVERFAREREARTPRGARGKRQQSRTRRRASLTAINEARNDMER